MGKLPQIPIGTWVRFRAYVFFKTTWNLSGKIRFITKEKLAWHENNCTGQIIGATFKKTGHMLYKIPPKEGGSITDRNNLQKLTVEKVYPLYLVRCGFINKEVLVCPEDIQIMENVKKPILPYKTKKFEEEELITYHNAYKYNIPKTEWLFLKGRPPIV